MSELRENTPLWNTVFTEVARHASQATKMSEIKASTKAIFDAFNRAAREPKPCCEKGARLAEGWVARYKCPDHGWQRWKQAASTPGQVIELDTPWGPVTARLVR
jgi:hypothetical protein